MDLLKSINADLTKQAALQDLVARNFAMVAESTNSTIEQLEEAVTSWIAGFRNVVSKGNIPAEKKQNMVMIMGALLALSDSDVADALDERGDLGTMLAAVSGDDAVASKAALQRLLQLGRHPSVRGYVEQVNRVIDNPEEAAQLANKIQVDIDKVMRTRLAAERNAANRK